VTRRRTALRLVALAAAAAAAIAPRPARASKADAFEGKIPPVAGQLYRKAGRFELTPTFDPSLNDAYFNKYFFGLKLGYHLTESWSVSAQAAGGFTSATASAVKCRSNTGCDPAQPVELYQVPGRIRALAGLEGAWSPVYAKLNFASEQVAHLDLSGLFGVDAISHDKVLSQADALALGAGQQPPRATSIGGHLGLGVRVYFSEWMALRLELKDYVYFVPVPNWRDGTSPHTSMENQLFSEIGLSFFLPLHARVTP
jgi:outer membrane beta-barrel protein